MIKYTVVMPPWVTVEVVPKSAVCLGYEGPEVVYVIWIFEDSGLPVSFTREQSMITNQTTKDENPISKLLEREISSRLSSRSAISASY